MDENQIRKIILDCMISSLIARRDRAKDFVLNTNLQVEAKLLDNQIDALEKEKTEINS